MSSFEPNAVIRGFQLTVVGSMSPYMFCFYFPAVQGNWFKMPRNPWLHKKFYQCLQSCIVSESAYAKTLIKVLLGLNLASHILSFALE
jgi:hypothetical protein